MTSNSRHDFIFVSVSKSPNIFVTLWISIVTMFASIFGLRNKAAEKRVEINIRVATAKALEKAKIAGFKSIRDIRVISASILGASIQAVAFKENNPTQLV